MAKKKSFADKLIGRTTDKTATKLADKISSGIVKTVTTKPKKKPAAKPSTVEEKPKTSARSKSTTEAVEQPKSSAPSPEAERMAMRYNTKRCPNCQGICFNSPPDCPYCFQDLRRVKPMSPKEFDELEQ